MNTNEKTLDQLALVTLFLIALMASVGCGKATTDKMNTALDNYNAQNSPSPSPSASPTAKPHGKAKASPNGQTVEVEVSVKVKVSNGQSTTDGGGEADRMQYSPKQVTLADAVANAPDQYRLASRSEILALFDNGYFTDLARNGQLVWSATEATGDWQNSNWSVDIKTGQSVPMDRNLKFPAVYLREIE